MVIIGLSTMPKTNKSLHFDKRQLLVLAVLLVGLYVIVPQIGSFHASWHLLSHPKTSFVVLAILLTIASYWIAALTYCLLALKRLKYFEELAVQLAAMFINRLLPAGIGGIGTNFEYLRHARHSKTQAASVVAINNALGLLGHGLLIGAALAFTTSRLAPTKGFNHSVDTGLEAVAGLVVIGLVITLIIGKSRLRGFLGNLKTEISHYKHRPLRVLAALASSMSLTVTYVLCLHFAILAIGIHLPLVVTLLIFTFALGTGNFTPTPGGLGGFEAGLAAALVAYRVPLSEALAAALLFRLITYWLPLIAGLIAFTLAQRQSLFKVTD
jgi:uncharacterized protein (TIRG00374 family)